MRLLGARTSRGVFDLIYKDMLDAPITCSVLRLLQISFSILVSLSVVVSYHLLRISCRTIM